LKSIKTYYLLLGLALNLMGLVLLFLFMKNIVAALCISVALIFSVTIIASVLMQLSANKRNHQVVNENIQSNTSFDSGSKSERSIEYGNYLLKQMYRQEDIVKAINFIGNEFNILQYNYFFVSNEELSSVVTKVKIDLDNADTLVASVFNSGIDKFVELDEGNKRIESALGNKVISCLYYIILRNEDQKLGIAELGCYEKIDADTMENLKMCLNELTKF
jgi:hypothetical protein